MEQNDKWIKLMREVSSDLEEKTGLYFPPDRWKMLHKKLESLRETLGMKSVLQFAHWLHNNEPNPKQTESLARSLTVGETYFFRDQDIYDELESHVLPEIIPKKRKDGCRKIRIWSAGCATGEEAYSIAITLKKAIPDIHDWDITILATDINRLALEKARQGIYRDWSFRGSKPGGDSRYFRKLESGNYQIDQEVRKMVKFQFLNLARDHYPSLTNNTAEFDVIFCRNVMIYFQSRLIELILNRYYDCLVDDGWLLVGGSEGAHVKHPQLKMVRFPKTTYFRKQDRSTAQIDPALPFTKPEIRLNSLHDFAEREIAPAEIKADTPEDQSASKRFTKGEALFERQKYMDAAEILESLTDSDMDGAKTRKLLVRSYLSIGRPGLALQHCEELVSLSPEDYQAYYLKGLIYKEMGEWAVALKQLHMAQYLEPSCSLIHYVAGSIYKQTGDHGKAIKHLERAALLFGKNDPEKQIPDSDGITVSGFSMIVQSMLCYLRNNEPKAS